MELSLSLEKMNFTKLLKLRQARRGGAAMCNAAAPGAAAAAGCRALFRLPRNLPACLHCAATLLCSAAFAAARAAHGPPHPPPLASAGRLPPTCDLAQQHHSLAATALPSAADCVSCVRLPRAFWQVAQDASDYQVTHYVDQMLQEQARAAVAASTRALLHSLLAHLLSSSAWACFCAVWL